MSRDAFTYGRMDLEPLPTGCRLLECFALTPLQPSKQAEDFLGMYIYCEF